MVILDLLKRESTSIPKDVYVAVALSGFANAGVLATINAAADSVTTKESVIKLLALFIVALVLYVYCLKYAFRTTNIIFEGVLHRMRKRLVNKLRASELLLVDNTGIGPIYDGLTQELAVISDSQGIIISAYQSGLMVFATLLYMTTLSFEGVIVTIVMITMAAVFYLLRQREAKSLILETTKQRIAFVEGVNQILLGFKEVKMSQARNDDIYAELKAISREVEESSLSTRDIYNNLFIFSQYHFYILLAVIVFVMPRFVPTHAESITELTASILFMIGPLGTVVNSIPAIAKANISAQVIQRLEESLDAHHTDQSTGIGLSDGYRDFKELRLEGVGFSYKNKDDIPQFGIGPIDLSIKRGETLFIVGGNGSGKSTFMKLLTALYPPSYGTVKLDNRLIDLDTVQDYRELFSIIFTDFHLFNKLYGIPNPDSAVVQTFLEKMKLEEKTQFDDNHFTKQDLSTGQKKRLALLVTYLEDREICIFDEWAADQDPEFRRFFYEDLLKELKAKGKTIIAVTHDDRYFHLADRVLKMEYGKVLFVKKGCDVKSEHV